MRKTPEKNSSIPSINKQASSTRSQFILFFYTKFKIPQQCNSTIKLRKKIHKQDSGNTLPQATLSNDACRYNQGPGNQQKKKKKIKYYPIEWSSNLKPFSLFHLDHTHKGRSQSTKQLFLSGGWTKTWEPEHQTRGKQSNHHGPERVASEPCPSS